MAKKKTVKPTISEAERIKRRLIKQYPQMYKKDMTPAQRRVIDSAPADTRKALLKMVGDKMKKIYRSK